MKNQIKIAVLLLLSTFIISCQGQENTDKSEKIIPQTEAETPDSDYYFTPSKIVKSPYGPTNITRNVIQDKNGIFWLATWEGIIQYNGKEFTNFTNKYDLSPTRVFALLEDRKGNIWFGTVGAGVYLYDGKTFTHITTKDGLVDDSTGCFMEDSAGNIWIGTQNGVSKYDGKTFTNFTTEDGLTNNDVNSIVEDKTGKLWFGTRGYACVYDGKIFTEFKNHVGGHFVNVRSIIEDTKGNIWLGGNDGLWSYNGSFFTNYATNFTGYIYEDKAGNIWTNSDLRGDGNSTNWVLSRYDAKSILNAEIPPNEIKTAADMFFGITEDADGNIWWGSLHGIHRFDPDGKEGVQFEDFR